MSRPIDQSSGRMREPPKSRLYLHFCTSNILEASTQTLGHLFVILTGMQNTSCQDSWGENVENLRNSDLLVLGVPEPSDLP